MMKYILTIIFSFALVLPVYATTTQYATVSTGVSTGSYSNTGTISTGTGDNVVVSKPTATPVPKSYSSAQSVTLTGGAGIRFIKYTTNSSTTTLACSSGTTYTTPIAVTISTTIQAISCYPESKSSDAVNFAYVISSNSSSSNNSSSGGNTSSSGGGGGAIIATPPTNNADFNGDSKVDITDLATLSANWGSTSATHTTGDANGDGKVDITDLAILSAQWTG